MIKVTNVEVFNFEGAFRGLRNPLESWDKSDSSFGESPRIGEKDLALAQRMIGAGADESKFMRQIFVSMDIEFPIYFGKELDTYKVSTVANSTSTMHKLASTPITEECFSFDFGEPIEDDEIQEIMTDIWLSAVENCEFLRRQYLETKDERYWRLLIQALPCAWNQKRTWTANYQVLRNIYFARRHHKLTEWREFCEEIERLPYAQELICYEKE